MKHTINRLMLALVVCTSSVAAPCGVHAQPAPARPVSRAATLVITLTTPTLSWQKRLEAETTLLKMPTEPVLLALVPEIAKGMPSDSFIWNGSGSIQRDAKSMPPSWQIYYAVGRVWGHHDNQSLLDKTYPYASVSRALVAALPTARSQGSVLNQLGSLGRTNTYWSAEAEKPVLALFEKTTTDPTVRLQALECLLEHTGLKYYAEAKRVALTWPQNSWQQVDKKASLVSLLLGAEWRRKNGLDTRNLDPELLRMGFALLPVMEKNKKGGGYFLAIALGDRVGQRFMPPQNAARYQGEHGLTDAYFADTTMNALKWWRKRITVKS